MKFNMRPTNSLIKCVLFKFHCVVPQASLPNPEEPEQPNSFAMEWISCWVEKQYFELFLKQVDQAMHHQDKEQVISSTLIVICNILAPSSISKALPSRFDHFPDHVNFLAVVVILN